jgi:protein PsiE
MLTVMKSKTKNLSVSNILQLILNISLILLGIVLCSLLLKELYYLCSVIFLKHSNFHNFLEQILFFFLYFEFISMIIKYFRDHYHFPLRYFIYIGITAIIRLIIVDHNNPKNTLLYAVVILTLIIGYFIINCTPLNRPKSY